MAQQSRWEYCIGNNCEVSHGYGSHYIWYGSNRRRQLFYGSRSIPCYRDFTYMIFTMLHDLFAKYLSSTTSRFSLSLYLSVSIRQIRGCLCPLPDLAKISNLKSQISNNTCFRYRFCIAKFGSSPDIYDSIIRITFVTLLSRRWAAGGSLSSQGRARS